MRIMVMFDLPTTSSEDLKIYREFRKFLIKSGFLMQQESIYCKIALNQTASVNIIKSVKKNKPKKGLVQILTVTEKQYAKMESITGEVKSEVLADDRRLVVL